MLGSLLRIVLLGISSMFIYRNRYRMVNFVLSNQWLRRYGIRLFMNMPFVRNRMAGNMFRFQ